jgi:hypothetical protein
MAIQNRQIGWSQESNLLWQILKQINKLTSVIFDLKPKYKVYTALLSQSGTASPTATVLENTTGANITFSRLSAGQYEIISDVLVFTVGKTFCIVTNNNSSTSTYIAGGGMYDETQGLIQAFDNTFAQIDFNCNNGIYLEIRVYN